MRSTTLGLLALLLATGCQDACWMDDYTFVRHGENVTVYGYGVTEADACAGSFAALDVHVGSIKDFLWADEFERYDYRWFSDTYWRSLDPCPLGTACAPDGEAWSRIIPDTHEAVHMVTHSIGDDGCPSVLDEGLAVYLSGPIPKTWGLSVHGIRRLLTAEQIPLDAREYELAGHFVSFLVERYGAGAIVQLCSAIPRRSTNVDWELAVGRYLDLTLGRLIEEYESYPRCTFYGFRARLRECGGDADFTFVGDDSLFSVMSGCDDSRTIDLVSGPLGSAVAVRRVYFPEDTWVAVSVFSEGDSGTPATFLSEQCAPCSSNPQTITLDESRSVEEFRAGLHTVSIFFDKRDTVQLHMSALP